MKIPINECVLKDERFIQLCLKLSDKRAAAGAVFLAWSLAAKYWCPDKKPIPVDVWVESGIGSEIIDVGLFVKTEVSGGGIMLHDAELHFAAWFKHREKSVLGGVASAASKRKKLEKSKKEHSTPGCQKVNPGLTKLQPRVERPIQPQVDQNPTPGSQIANPGLKKVFSPYKEYNNNILNTHNTHSTPDVFSTSRSSRTVRLSESITDLENQYNNDTDYARRKIIKRPPSGDAGASLRKMNFRLGGIITAYQTAYKSRYNAEPHVGDREKALMRKLLSGYDDEKLKMLIQVFVQMNDNWFKTKCHDFVTFYENVGKVNVALSTGREKLGEKSVTELIDDWENEKCSKKLSLQKLQD